MALEDWLKQGLSAAREYGGRAAEAVKAGAQAASDTVASAANGLRGARPSTYDAQVRNWVANERRPLDRILAAEQRANAAPVAEKVAAASKTGLRGALGRGLGAAGTAYAGYEGARATGLDTAAAAVIPWVGSKFDDNPSNDYPYGTWRRLTAASQDGPVYVPATASDTEVNALLDKRGLRQAQSQQSGEAVAVPAQPALSGAAPWTATTGNGATIYAGPNDSSLSFESRNAGQDLPLATYEAEVARRAGLRSAAPDQVLQTGFTVGQTAQVNKNMAEGRTGRGTFSTYTAPDYEAQTKAIRGLRAANLGVSPENLDLLRTDNRPGMGLRDVQKLEAAQRVAAASGKGGASALEVLKFQHQLGQDARAEERAKNTERQAIRAGIYSEDPGEVAASRQQATSQFLADPTGQAGTVAREMALRDFFNKLGTDWTTMFNPTTERGAWDVLKGWWNGTTPVVRLNDIKELRKAGFYLEGDRVHLPLNAEGNGEENYVYMGDLPQETQQVFRTLLASDH